MSRWVDDLLELVASHRPWDAEALVLEHYDQHGSVVATIDQLLAPVQELSGRRWQRAEWTVAQEHELSSVVDNALGALMVRLPRPTGVRTVGLICAEGEWHATPARMAAAILREQGWRVRLFGPSVPTSHLGEALRRSRVDLLAVSCTVPLFLPGVVAVCAVGRDLGLPVLAGGRAFDPAGSRAARLGCSGHAPNASTASALLQKWLDDPPDPPAPPTEHAEVTTLAEHRDDLVTQVYERLWSSFPPMGSYDERQQTRTREDLAYILMFLEVSVALSDPGLFTEFVDWLLDVLVTRGVPAKALVVALEHYLDLLAERAPTAAEYLASARKRLPVGSEDH